MQPALGPLVWTAIDISEYPNNGQGGYDWLAGNAHQYGFTLSYPKGQEERTGFEYEPWHWRYVGVELATYIHEHDILFNHEEAVILPSPFDGQITLPYEYQGRDIWVWKALEKGSSVDVLVSGNEDVFYSLDLEELVQLFDKGLPLSRDNKFELSVSSWVVDVKTRSSTDSAGVVWLHTSLASPNDTEHIERLEVLYNERLGYILISHQEKDVRDRLTDKVISLCPLM